MAITRIEVHGRRWFQRTYGNTYHTVCIRIESDDADGAAVMMLDRAYGYGDYYMQRAADWLEENGYMPGREHYPNGGGAEPAWQYFRDRGIPFFYSATDVPRQKDL